jgi:hypothetical protein
MYYDSLLAALPVVVLFAEPSRYAAPLLGKRYSGPEDWPVPPLLLVPLLALPGPLMFFHRHKYGYPVETYLLLLLWGWCGWLWRGTAAKPC